MDLDDKLLYKFFHWEEEFSILKQKHKKELVVINEIEKNLSGITYNENTDTLYRKQMPKPNGSRHPATTGTFV
mgnify:CR=1 FL=1